MTTRCEQTDACAFDPGCDSYPMSCSAIEAEEREIVERRRPEIEAEVRAEVVEEAVAAVVHVGQRFGLMPFSEYAKTSPGQMLDACVERIRSLGRPE